MRPLLRPTLFALLAPPLLSSLPSLAEAQARPGTIRPVAQAGGGAAVGVRGGRDFRVDAWSAGAHAHIPLFSARELLIPSADLFFVADGTDWQANLDGAFGGPPLPALYSGLGLAVLHRDFDDDGERERKVGLNLFAGLQVPDGLFVRPFVEARFTRVGGAWPFRLVAGVNVPLGG